MRMFIINLCVVTAAIWLTAGFAHFIIAWYHFDQIQKTDKLFWKAHLFGTIILIIAFTALWSVHLRFFTNRPMVLEGLFISLITIGLPIIRYPIHKLYLALKIYEEN
ncbi:hypothetical protein [Lactobacillus sp. Sy-1]|uniref:hypothetical protein n=1 Tax=Lactobacillus sp. Sy-1 TaxID=2109645 RepID=UPI001C5BCC1A|nr:hypothetical protein [Lactobacillus sp. Sy-1]MBW1606212.1 hypothetical protein [Lactobacillus sp. Sy-1]